MDKSRMELLSEWSELKRWLKKYGDMPEHKIIADGLRSELKLGLNDLPFNGRFKLLSKKPEVKTNNGRPSVVPLEHEHLVWAFTMLHSQTRAAKRFGINASTVKSMVKRVEATIIHSPNGQELLANKSQGAKMLFAREYLEVDAEIMENEYHQ
tara:strand:- start:3157 stop:3615 length:459 start_codon:yes stop_codon:yes gene_type:complete